MTKEEERAKVAEFAEALAKIISKNNSMARTYEIAKAITNFYEQLKRADELKPFKYMQDSEVKAAIVETVRRLYGGKS